MDLLYLVHLFIVSMSVVGGCSCFIYLLFKLPKYFNLVGWSNIMIMAFFLSLVWPIVFLYNILTWYAEKYSKDKP